MKLYMLLGMLAAQEVVAQSMHVKVQNIEVIGYQEGSELVDFIPSVTKLEGEELVKKRQTSLGDTLSSETGVSTTQFGPSASRPVIRGLDGARIRVLQNSLGTLDASTQSLDHAIPVDTLTLDSIEVVRGPMSLLYGSSAVGGVVNLVTRKIHRDYEPGAHARFFSQGESVNDGISSGASLDYGVSKWMFHLDGSTRNLQNQRIPGDARSQAKKDSTPLAAGESEATKKLPNSYNKQANISGGVSRIFNRGYLGISYDFFDTTYGTVAEENVAIDMTQKRFELHGEYDLHSSPFHKVRLRSAQSNYLHKEIESGTVGTTFKNQGNESRLELLNKKGSWEGASGVQTQIYQFSAIGDEAFLPESDTNQVALFSYQQLGKGKNTYSAGVRLEGVEVDKKASTNFGAAENQDFLLYNGSLGYQYKLTSQSSISSNYSYTERNPNFQELYANGDHVATGTYERGSNSLNKEKAHALELSYKRQTDNHTLETSIYAQRFDGFIFLSSTGTTSSSSLPIYDYESDGATFYGLDVKNKNFLGMLSKGELNLTTQFDFVRARNTTKDQNLPRITPPRLSAELEYRKNFWSTDLKVQHVTSQDHRAPGETKTDPYTLTELGVSYDIVAQKYAINLFARVRNIFDVTARNHVSTLKDIAPLPGRNIMAGIQASF